MRTIAAPIAPKLLARLDNWRGKVASELEIETCLVRDQDFTAVKRLEIEGCRLSGTQLAGAKFDKLQLSDAILERIEAAGLRAPDAGWLRTEARNSRLTGVDFGAGLFEDCVFENAKCDEAGFRFATFKRVRFENCVLRGADFSGAKFAHVSFAGCDLAAVNLDSATCKSVDLRGENLANIKGVLGLKGATISNEQLIQLAPLLAAELGLSIDET